MEAWNEQPRLVTVAEGLVVRQAIDNMGWIDMGGYTLVVDALEQDSLADEVAAAIKNTVGDQEIRFLLNTHSHYDHTALNSFFQERYGTAVVDPSVEQIPEEGRWFEGENRRALMRPTHGCHTPEDCIVWFPADRVLFTGDIFGWGLIPWEGDLVEEKRELLVRTYEYFLELDPAAVVPGHGPLCSAAELRRWLDYFEHLIREVEQLMATGMTDAAIQDSIPPPEDMRTWWRFVEWKHRDSLRKVISAVRAGYL